ncbi:MAG: MFS transporter [Verrucomicrobia bacterium]|nr:MAG: MFS transporter [Verrucomicrobiota bacterium]
MSEPAAEHLTARRRLPAAVIALGVTSFFADVGSEMIFPLLPVFVASLGASTTFLGLVEGLADATSSLLKLGSGYVADHTRRRKPLVLFGYGVAALVRPLVALATAPWHVLAVRVTDRVGKGVRSAPRDVLIAGSVSKEETGRAFGFHRAMDHAGAVVGPLVATALLGLGWPLRSVFWAALIPGVLSVIAVATVREPRVDAPAPDEMPSVEPRRLPGSLRSYFAILLLFSLGNSSDAFLLLRAKDLGVPIASLPLLWAVFHVAKLVSSYLGGGWSDRIARPKLIVSGWMVYAATYLAFGVATRSWHAWALFIVYGIYYGLTEPAEKALVKDLAPTDARGRAYGFYSFIIGVSAVPAGVLTGWLWQTWSPFVALSMGAGIAAASSVALIVWGRSRGTEAR